MVLERYWRNNQGSLHTDIVNDELLCHYLVVATPLASIFQKLAPSSSSSKKVLILSNSKVNLSIRVSWSLLEAIVANYGDDCVSLITAEEGSSSSTMLLYRDASSNLFAPFGTLVPHKPWLPKFGRTRFDILSLPLARIGLDGGYLHHLAM
jgi:hypothetical protein